jgi:nucleoside-diphosphate-sugar epimerase
VASRRGRRLLEREGEKLEEAIGNSQSSDTSVLMTSAPVKSRGQLLVLGGGYSGLRFATAMAQAGFDVTVTHRGQRDSASADPWRWLAFDPDAGLVPSASDLAGTTHLLSTIPPDRQGLDPALEALAPLLRQLPLDWVGYLSTTGVYGDRQGGWVDETSAGAPGLERSRARLAGEQAWLSSGLPVQSFRLPAIYGPGRSPFAGLQQGTSRLVHKPGQVFCRIHVDDIVGALSHCQGLPAQARPPLVNVSDDCPCPSGETLGFAAHLLGCTLPPVQTFASVAASMGPMALSFWAENRRISNRLLCRELGYQLRYPSYREGLVACLAEERAGAPAPGPAG